MKLFIMAHRGEAQTFLKSLQLKLVDESLGFYVDEASEYGLLISGEGHFELMTKLPFILAKYETQAIYNYGIAGALDNELQIGEIHSIRTCYSFLETKPQFKSFTASDSSAKMDCISSLERILDNNRAKKLSHFAPIVDQEVWALGFCAKTHKIPFYSYKLISDFATSETNCFDIKQKALEFSNKMYEHFKSISHPSKVTQNQIEFPITEASFTQKKRIEKLIEKLSYKSEKTIQDYIQESKIDISKKNNINIFCSFLESKIAPTESEIFQKIEDTLSPFSSIGVKIQLDQKKESEHFSLQMNVNSKKNLDNLSQALTEFNYSEYTDLWRGKADV